MYRLLTIDSTVGTVSTSSHFRSLLGLSVGNTDIIDGKTFGLTVGLQVGQQIQIRFGGFLWPKAAVTRGLELFGLSVSTSATSVFSQWDGFLKVQDVLQEHLSSLQTHTFDGVGNLTAVLVVHSQISSTSFSGYIVNKNNK